MRRGASFNSHNTNQTVASDFSELLTRLNPSFCPLASLFWFIFVFLILQSCLILQTVLCLSIYLYKTKAKNNCESECTVLIHPRFFDFHGTREHARKKQDYNSSLYCLPGQTEQSKFFQGFVRVTCTCCSGITVTLTKVSVQNPFLSQE